MLSFPSQCTKLSGLLSFFVDTSSRRSLNMGVGIVFVMLTVNPCFFNFWWFGQGGYYFLQPSGRSFINASYNQTGTLLDALCFIIFTITFHCTGQLRLVESHILIDLNIMLLSTLPVRHWRVYLGNGGSRMGHLPQMPPLPSRNCIQDRDTLIEQSITLMKQSQCS